MSTKSLVGRIVYSIFDEPDSSFKQSVAVGVIVEDSQNRLTDDSGREFKKPTVVALGKFKKVYLYLIRGARNDAPEAKFHL